MFLSFQSVFAFLFLATCVVAVPTVPQEMRAISKRAYSPEFKATTQRVGELWKGVETSVQALPANATVDQFRVVKSDIDKLTAVTLNEWYPIAHANGVFTNTKWSDEFLGALLDIHAAGANAMKLLRSFPPQANTVGKDRILLDIQTSLGNLLSALGLCQQVFGDILKFVGGPSLLGPIQKLSKEIRDTEYAFYRYWCDIYSGWCYAPPNY